MKRHSSKIFRIKRKFKKWRKNKHHPPHHSFQYLGQLTDHHFWPISRGGNRGKDNVGQVPRLRHNAWHLLFQNLTPEEIIEIIKTKTKNEITENKRSRLMAWEIVFGYWETTLEERIKIIEKYWMFQKKRGP